MNEAATVCLAILAVSALALTATDEPEGDEETARCVEAYEGTPALPDCSDGGPLGFGALAALFGLAALAAALDRRNA